MAYKRKYAKGSAITSLDELAHQEFVYIWDKIYHAGWFMSLQLSLLKRYIERGVVFKAERRAEDGK